MIRFSVVTITFNAAGTLSRTLESVESQTWSALEHIIVDGASKDGTVAMACDYRKRCADNPDSHHVVTVVSEPDRGLYDAMNKGLAMAQGDYILFLNAGDYFPDATILEKIASRPELQTDDRSQWPAVLYGETNIVDEEGRYLGKRHLSPPKHLSWRSFCRGMLVCHQAFYARVDIARTIPYNLRYRFSADVDWCIRVMKQAASQHLSLLCLGMPVVNYLKEGQTTRNHRASLKERFDVMTVHYGWVLTVVMHGWFVVRGISKKILP